MERVYETIRRYHMIEPGMHVLAGISGGADSVCLLLALAEYRRQEAFEVTAVHVEHGLRGAESLEDAEYVKRLCAGLGIAFRMEQVDVRRLAQERRLSVEEAGRTARYACFARLKRELGADRIAVAHNQNDQAETVLWNLARGSGLRGLGGILPVRGDLIRPLLFLERAEIEQILRARGVMWRTDRTNLELDYTRNRIRLQLLPEMEKTLNSRVVPHIASAAARLQEVQSYLEEETDRAANACISVKAPGENCWEALLPLTQEADRGRKSGLLEVRLDLTAFRKERELIQKELLRRCLLVCIGLKDIGSVHLEALLTLASMPCGREQHLPGGLRAVREYETIRFCVESSPEKEPRPVSCEASSDTALHAQKRPQDTVRTVVPGERFLLGNRMVTTELLANTPQLMREICEEKKYTKWISYDTINTDLCFRTRRPGDYFVLDGRGGRKKLKEDLIDRKVPRTVRDQIWLLACGSHILWMVGGRLSYAARVTEETVHVLKIQIEEETE